MGLEIPAEVQWLSWIVGTDWPEGDETAMRRCAEAWTQAASDINDLIPNLQRTASDVLGSVQGQAADNFEQFWDKFVNTDPQYLPKLAELCEMLAEVVEGGATEIEYAKYMFIALLIITAIEITMLIAEMAVTFGASAAGIPVVEAAAQITSRTIFQNLLRAIARGAISGLLQGAGLDFLIQAIQVAQGHRDGINLKQTAMAGMDGAIGGAISGGVSYGMGHVPGLSGIADSATGNAVRGAVRGGVSEAVSGVAGTAASAAIHGDPITAHSLAQGATSGAFGGAVGGGREGLKEYRLADKMPSGFDGGSGDSGGASGRTVQVDPVPDFTSSGGGSSDGGGSSALAGGAGSSDAGGGTATASTGGGGSGGGEPAPGGGAPAHSDAGSYDTGGSATAGGEDSGRGDGSYNRIAAALNNDPQPQAAATPSSTDLAGGGTSHGGAPASGGSGGGFGIADAGGGTSASPFGGDVSSAGGQAPSPSGATGPVPDVGGSGGASDPPEMGGERGGSAARGGGVPVGGGVPGGVPGGVVSGGGIPGGGGFGRGALGGGGSGSGSGASPPSVLGGSAGGVSTGPSVASPHGTGSGETTGSGGGEPRPFSSGHGETAGVPQGQTSGGHPSDGGRTPGGTSEGGPAHAADPLLGSISGTLGGESSPVSLHPTLESAPHIEGSGSTAQRPEGGGPGLLHGEQDLPSVLRGDTADPGVPYTEDTDRGAPRADDVDPGSPRADDSGAPRTDADIDVRHPDDGTEAGSRPDGTPEADQGSRPRTADPAVSTGTPVSPGVRPGAVEPGTAAPQQDGTNPAGGPVVFATPGPGMQASPRLSAPESLATPSTQSPTSAPDVAPDTGGTVAPGPVSTPDDGRTSPPHTDSPPTGAEPGSRPAGPAPGSPPPGGDQAHGPSVVAVVQVPGSGPQPTPDPGGPATQGPPPPSSPADGRPDPARDLRAAEAEARQIMADHGVDAAVVDFTSNPIDPAAAHEINNSLRALAAEYPETFRQVQNLGSVDVDATLGPGHDGVLAYTIPGDTDAGIFFSQDAYGDLDAAQADGAADEASGFLAPGSGSIEGTVYHEFAHLFGENIVNDPAALADLNRAVSDVLGVPYDATQPHDVQTADLIRDRLSDYGAEDPHEMISEAFAEYKLSNNPGQLAQAIGGVLDRHFGGDTGRTDGTPGTAAGEDAAPHSRTTGGEPHDLTRPGDVGPTPDGAQARAPDTDVATEHAHDTGAQDDGHPGEPVPPDLPQHLHDVYGDSEPTPAGRSLYGPDEQNMRDLARRVQADPNQYVLDGHGTPDGMRAAGRELSAGDIADVIRNDPNWNGREVLLLSCDTGRDGGAFAANLARELGVPVVAPDGLAWSDNQGRVFSSSSQPGPEGRPRPTWPPDGGWNTFHPDGTSTPAGEHGFPSDHDQSADAATGTHDRPIDTHMRDGPPGDLSEGSDGGLHRDGDPEGTYRSEDGKLHFPGDPEGSYRNEQTHRLHGESGQFVKDPLLDRGIDHPADEGERHPYQPSDGARADLDALAQQRAGLADECAQVRSEMEPYLREFGLDDHHDLSKTKLDEKVRELTQQVRDDPTLSIEEKAAKLDRLADLKDLAEEHNSAQQPLVRTSEQMGMTGAEDFAMQERGGTRLTPLSDKPGTPGTIDVVAFADGDLPRLISVEAKGGSSGLGTRIVDGGMKAEQGSPEYLRSVLARDPDLTAALDANPEIRAKIEQALQNGTLEVEYHRVHVSESGAVRHSEFNLGAQDGRPQVDRVAGITGDGGPPDLTAAPRGGEEHHIPGDGAEHGGAESGDAEPGDAEPGGAEPGGATEGGAEPTAEAKAAVNDRIAPVSPELASVLNRLLDNLHPLNLTDALRDPARREHVTEMIRDMAAGEALRDYGDNLEEFRRENPGEGPLFEPVAHDVNTNENGESRKQAYVEDAKQRDEARQVDRDATPEQVEQVREYQRRLKDDVEPAVRAELSRLVDELRNDLGEQVTSSVRTKDAAGLLDKVDRMMTGRPDAPGRAGYEVGDVIDACGARITVPDMAALGTLYERIQQQFGVGDGGRILEIENMYAEPKAKAPEYRVIPMIIGIEVNGMPYTFELQLTTQRASIAADIEHNSVYKPYVGLSDIEAVTVMQVMAEAAALDQLEPRRGRDG